MNSKSTNHGWDGDRYKSIGDLARDRRVPGIGAGSGYTVAAGGWTASGFRFSQRLAASDNSRSPDIGFWQSPIGRGVLLATKHLIPPGFSSGSS
jgi:hypothetical protein